MAQQDVVAVPLNTVKAADHLYLVGGLDGQIGSFRHFAELVPSFSVTGLVLARPAPRRTTAAVLVDAYHERIRQIESAVPGSRVHIGGYSAGAYLALDIARSWPTSERLGTLLVLDMPVQPGPLPGNSALQGQWHLARDHGYQGSWEQFVSLGRAERIKEVSTQWDGGHGAESERIRWTTHLFTTIERNSRAWHGHLVEPYHGEVGVVIAQDTRSTSSDPAAWRAAFPNGAKLVTIPGGHTDLPAAHMATQLAEAISELLR